MIIMMMIIVIINIICAGHALEHDRDAYQRAAGQHAAGDHDPAQQAAPSLL